MEQDKLLKVDNTIEKLCDFLQKETERVASIYESQELIEMAKALAELMLNKGMLKIYEDCKDCINEFGMYRWDEEKSEDAVIKENDHAMDDVRYFCYTFLRRRLRWQY